MDNLNIELSKDEEIKKILGLCAYSTKYCAKTLFSDTFYSPFSSLHNAIFNLIDSGQKRIAIAAPRGLGKTSIAKTVAKKAILFRLSNFITYIMNSATIAEQQTENIKFDLMANRYVRGLFGSIKESDFDYELDEQFSKMAWVAFGNTLVLPRGQGQQVRGINWRDKRPQLVICDDLENKEEICNLENRVKLKNWFYSDVMKSFDFYSGKWTVIYIDTIKHEDSLLQELIDSPQWASITLSICDDNYQSLDPNYMSTEEIKEEVDEHRRLGTLDVFYMERMNVPVAKENAAFKQEFFKDHDEVEISKQKGLENVVIVDPAKTLNMRSADSAIVGISIDTKENKLHIRDIVSEKLYPDDLYNEAFSMCARLNSKVMGVEITSLEEFIKQPFLNEAIKRNWKGEFVWLKARGGLNDERGKVERIKALVPYYRQGNITHNPACCMKLEKQLLSYPKSKLWDVMDATAYIIELMEIGGRYFETEESDNYDTPSEAEYSDIVSDPMIENWRMV
jgi:hypothetical protein